MVDYQMRSGVAWITLNTPETGNSLSLASVTELKQALCQALAVDSCRSIVLAAVGDDFCRGLDLASDWESSGRETSKRFAECLLLLAQSPRPVLARVEGAVTGGGVGLVAACDLVLANEGVTFQLSEVIVGMIPALITPMLLRRMTSAQLCYMALSTQPLEATAAKAIGLVDQVVAANQMDPMIKRQLKRLFRSSPAAIARTKDYIHEISALVGLDAQMKAADSALTHWLAAPENLAGIQAFASGESPPWFELYRD